VIPLIDVETLATWVVTLVAKVVAIIRATGEAVVTCGHEVLYGTGITESGYALAKALTEAGSLGGLKLNLKGTGWKTDGTSWLMDGGEVASGMECVVISGVRLMSDKSLARVLALSVRLGLAHCWEVTPIIVPGARTTLDMSPAGVPASSARSGLIADEVPPRAWPRLLRLLLLRRGGWWGKPGCSSSAAGRCRRRVCLHRASR
jgi:hypothetical protein